MEVNSFKAQKKLYFLPPRVKDLINQCFMSLIYILERLLKF